MDRELDREVDRQLSFEKDTSWAALRRAGNAASRTEAKDKLTINNQSEQTNTQKKKNEKLKPFFFG